MIMGGEGDDFISSSGNIDSSRQQMGPQDQWRRWGQPQERLTLVQASTWGVYEEASTETEPDGNNQQTIWSGMLATPININSIANYSYPAMVICQKSLRKTKKPPVQRCSRKKHKPNRPIAVVGAARSATEFAVIRGAQ